jgi:CTP:molybdopterin cytidylyltransferase MocA
MKKKINIVITMAGNGIRFRHAGYDLPKFMITVHGKTLFEWSLNSLDGLKDYVEMYVFIIKRDVTTREFVIKLCNDLRITNYKIVELSKTTDGQATTALIGLKAINNKYGILIYNIDTYVKPAEINISDFSNNSHIPCSELEGDNWSFVKIDESGNAIEVAEKVRISKNCSIGAYYFPNHEVYLNAYHDYYGELNKFNITEKYIAPIYNSIIKNGDVVTINLINPNNVHVLGTPSELERFAKADIL